MAPEAWDRAERAAREARVELRPLTGLEDADGILRVMDAAWPGHEPIPREVLRALADSGNVPYGAFEGDEVVGYVMGWVGVDVEDGLHVHSHMLAAVPERRHRGIGFALKLAQRAQALDQGFTVARWTFDPLVARNGFLNLHKLGALADRFDRNHYGEMSDALNAGERSDRFTVRWDLEREPGPRALAATESVLSSSDTGWPGEVRVPSERSALVEVPRTYDDVRARDRACASAWREASARAIEVCLSAALVAAGFDRERSAYVFAHREDLRS